jgi:hypothetical protein
MQAILLLYVLGCDHQLGCIVQSILKRVSVVKHEENQYACKPFDQSNLL